MFINGSAIGVALHLFAIMIVVLAGVLVAHVIWIFRLARTPALMDRPLPVRLLLVASALATPVLSFYAVEIAALWRRRASVAWRAACWQLVILAALVIAVAAAGATDAELRYAPEYRSDWHAAEIFLRLIRFQLIALALLFMILRVLSSGRRPALAWCAFLIAAAILVFLLV